MAYGGYLDELRPRPDDGNNFHSCSRYSILCGRVRGLPTSRWILRSGHRGIRSRRSARTSSPQHVSVRPAESSGYSTIPALNWKILGTNADSFSYQELTAERRDQQRELKPSEA